jgi:hypothetical protein
MSTLTTATQKHRNDVRRSDWTTTSTATAARFATPNQTICRELESRKVPHVATMYSTVTKSPMSPTPR